MRDDEMAINLADVMYIIHDPPFRALSNFVDTIGESSKPSEAG